MENRRQGCSGGGGGGGGGGAFVDRAFVDRGGGTDVGGGGGGAGGDVGWVNGGCVGDGAVSTVDASLGDSDISRK